MEEIKMEQIVEQPEQGGMTQQDVDARIQQAVEKARADWERAQMENQRVAAMTAEERAGYELNRREAELNEREKQLLRRELKAMALEKLAERGLPADLAEALPYDSEQACMNGLDKLERAFRAAVQQAVDERLRGETPVTGMNRRMDAEAMSDAEYYRLNTKFGQ